MAISSPGLGSGLDVTGIVSQLMAIEQQPLVKLNQKEAQVQAEISAYGSLKGALSSLQDALGELKDVATFQATSARSTDAEVLAASSTTGAVASSYSVTVNRLAQQHKLGSSEFASSDTFGGTAGDELSIAVGTANFTLDLSTAMTLSEIQAAINVESNETGVTAGLISGDNENQTLVLTSGESGYDNRVQLSFDGFIDATTFNFAMLNRDADDQLLAVETDLDASLTVDGVVVTRNSNEIDDVVEGLTLDLEGAGQTNVFISPDISVAKDAVQGFVAAYNDMKDQLTTLAKSGANSSVIRSLESQLRGMLNNGISGLGDYGYISELGVTSNAGSGKLELDSNRLTTALSENSESVLGFFSDEDDGFAVRLDGLVDALLKSGGTIDSIVQGANDRIDGIERSRDSLERRLEMIEKRYLNQFAALDSLMVSMTTTSDYLATQLDALSNLINRNDN